MEMKKMNSTSEKVLYQAVRAWLPNRGTVLFVLAILAVLFFTNRVGAFPLLAPTGTSTSVIAYQGRLTNASNTPLTGNYNIGFRLYSASSGGSALWTEQWNNVQVSNGLFNVLLGSVTAIPQSVITGNNTLWLGITVGSDSEMTPRVQLGSVPFATQALTVPNGSITAAKLNLDNDVKLLSGKRLWLRSDQSTYAAGYFIHSELSQPNAPIRIVGTNDNATPRFVEFGHYTDETPTWQRKAFISTLNGNAYFGGNVGIGYTNPIDILHLGQGNTPTGIRWERTGYDVMRLGLIGTGFSVHNVTDNRYDLVVTPDGKIGIGLTDPVTRLHINTSGTNGIRLSNPVSGGGDWNIYTGDSGCFGDSLGIGPTVSAGAGQCGSTLGTAVTIGKNGSFTATGTKSAVVKTNSYGQRKLYAIEAPDVRFSDEGIATLQNGFARISLDPIFLETIEGRFIVHVTPYGNAMLYVDEIGADYFVVKARDSDSNIEFAWRLSAIRKGYQGTRLERLGE